MEQETSVKFSREEIIAKVEELFPWYHRIHIIDDIYTPGDFFATEHRWDCIKEILPKNLKGMQVLDIGCNSGIFSLNVKSLGADYVLGIDFEHYIKQANFIKEVKNAKDVEFKTHSLYTLPLSEKFNLTLCMGVLYHLKYPFLALQKISEITTEMVLLETEVLVNEEDTDKMKFIEHSYRNDETVWWVAGEECLKGCLRAVGFKYVKSFAYPDTNLGYGKDYSLGLTQEGIQKGKRMIIIGCKTLRTALGRVFSETGEVAEKGLLSSLLDSLNL